MVPLDLGLSDDSVHVKFYDIGRSAAVPHGDSFGKISVNIDDLSIFHGK